MAGLTKKAYNAYVAKGGEVWRQNASEFLPI